MTFRLPEPLRELAGGASSVSVEGGSLREALDRLAAEAPLLAGRLLADDGRVRPYVHLYMDGRDARDPDSVPPLRGDVEIAVVPSIAGGRPAPGPALTPEERARYHRQMILPEVGEAGQRRLRSASVLVVGAGGLGSPAALYLAAAGVGRLGLVDSDAVDASNLHRQVLHDTPAVGRAKVEVASERLGRLNPSVEIETHAVRLDASNAMELFGRGWDLVLDGSDNFPTRYLVNDACVLLGIPLVYGAILRFEGQVSLFAAPGGPCYRCLFREPPPPGLVPGCAEAGVLGPLPGLVGSIQAAEALKWLLGAGRPLTGRLLLVDAAEMTFREVAVRRDPACPLCGDAPTITGPIDYEAFCGGPGDGGPDTESSAADGTGPEGELPFEIGVEELRDRLAAGASLQLVDVREAEEREISDLRGVAGIRHIPMGELTVRYGELDPERETVVYCRSGARSGRAVEFLRDRGLAGARNLRGGMNEWVERVDPSQPRY
ncbi:MAG: molybdopterin-synthase adenylyltransferase MoeB [Gemmatimonadota bacterium]|nr:molybdopterin-synthase adenylyltransferase MoeB [Gemmatimonadota bacterium]